MTNTFIIIEESQIVKDPNGHYKDISFYSEWYRKSLECFEQRSKTILHFNFQL